MIIAMMGEVQGSIIENKKRVLYTSKVNYMIKYNFWIKYNLKHSDSLIKPFKMLTKHNNQEID
eukprot:CAMPEP_0116944238 /NCGR_PEP_ID=MMETSP0467-20121206/35664_1 /TAXON_ID=283647 /ORGANISM="Mesodinium pulex, Strain SPMC105" /LENGTH=62 /DNA_ID=CAMNT_0004627573 /DNA_START=595 /DNA_END=783 /DNA_ORIENTATION=+